MNFYNLIAGLTIIGIGLILNIIMIIPMTKKFNSFFKILILLLIIFLTNIIANSLWKNIPENVMPHCLECMMNSIGYIWDKNDIRDITVKINCIYGIVWCIYIGGTSVARIAKKKDIGDNVLIIVWSIVSIMIICFLQSSGCSTHYK